MKKIISFLIQFSRLIACRKFDNMWNTMSLNWKLNDTESNAGKRVSKLHYVPNMLVIFTTVSLFICTFGTLWMGIYYDEASNTSQPLLQMMELPFNINTQTSYLTFTFIILFYMVLLSNTTITINAILIVMVSLQYRKIFCYMSYYLI